MPKITIVLEDTPQGGVSVHSTYQPSVGQPCSRAQAAALEIVNRTTREWGLPPKPVAPAVQAATDWAAA